MDSEYTVPDMVFKRLPFLLVALFLTGYYTPAGLQSQLWVPVLAAGVLLAAGGAAGTGRLLLCCAALLAGTGLTRDASCQSGTVDGRGGVWTFSVVTTTSAGALLHSRETGSVWASGRELPKSCARGDSVCAIGWLRGGFMSVSAFSVKHSSAFQDRLRRRLAATLVERIPSRAASSLAAALTAGERGYLPLLVRDAFRRTGTSHLLALSGLHVGILAAAALSLFRGLTGRGVFASAAAILVCGLFVMVSGGRPSTIRAWIMLTAVVTLWHLFGRTPDLLMVWSVAAVLILAVSGPGVLNDVGAQMSFAAVLSLVLMGRRFEGRGGWFLSAGYAGIVVTLALAPLVSSVYGGFNPVAPIATVVSIPFMLALMILGILTLLPLMGAAAVLAEWTVYLWFEILEIMGTGGIVYRPWMTWVWAGGISGLWLFSRRRRYLFRFR